MSVSERDKDRVIERKSVKYLLIKWIKTIEQKCIGNEQKSAK